MKKFILTISIFTTLLASTYAWSFGSSKKEATTDTERERRIEAQAHSAQLQQQLSQQQSKTEKWQIATGSFAVGCVLLFGIGTALGAKARRDEKKS